MPNRGGRRRTDSQSETFKAEIIKLRSQERSVAEIAKQLHVSKQYVSNVLIEAGLGRKGRLRAKLEAEKGDIEQDISRLEKQKDHTLATWLRVLVQRRKE
jgi:transposase-like protein